MESVEAFGRIVRMQKKNGNYVSSLPTLEPRKGCRTQKWDTNLSSPGMLGVTSVYTAEEQLTALINGETLPITRYVPVEDYFGETIVGVIPTEVP